MSSQDDKYSDWKSLPEENQVPMKCLNCGNTDVNKMLVFYCIRTRKGETVMDATTLPQFLFYLKYPGASLAIFGGKNNFRYAIDCDGLFPVKVEEIRCDDCRAGSKGERPKIEPTLFGA